MRIILIGSIAFFAWSTLSVYLYVCKIKGLCDDPVSMQIGGVGNDKAVATDSILMPVVREQLSAPKDLVVYFAFDKSEFNANDIPDKYVDESSAYLKQDTQAGIIITGHTDAIGTNGYNQALGFRRAQSMQHYFQTKGIKTGEIIISSKGESEPAENNSTKEGRAKNRRAVLTINK